MRTGGCLLANGVSSKSLSLDNEGWHQISLPSVVPLGCFLLLTWRTLALLEAPRRQGSFEEPLLSFSMSVQLHCERSGDSEVLQVMVDFPCLQKAFLTPWYTFYSWYLCTVLKHTCLCLVPDHLMIVNKILLSLSQTVRHSTWQWTGRAFTWNCNLEIEHHCKAEAAPATSLSIFQAHKRAASYLPSNLPTYLPTYLPTSIRPINSTKHQTEFAHSWDTSSLCQ